MRKYQVATTGFLGYVLMTETELKQYVKEETTKARHYFKTAVCHKSKSELRYGTLYYKITAGKDENSALWCHITAHLY